jgi:hypothetical protein
MARIYARRIRAGIMTLDEVPERWRAATEKLLEGGE